MTDFNAWSSSALWTLLEVSLQATLCLVVILLLRRALGKHLRPDWRYALWGVLIIRMLLPFSYDMPVLMNVVSVTTIPELEPQTVATPPVFVDLPDDRAGREPSPAQNPLPIETPAVVVPLPSVATVEQERVPQAIQIIGSVVSPAIGYSNRMYPYSSILFSIWLTGAVAIFGTVIARHARLTRTIEDSAEPAPDTVSHIVRQVREDLGLSLWPVVLLTTSVATPTAIGVFRPRILLPKSLVESASNDELRLILLHELAHVRSRDLWIAWLWLAALALHWFNPAMWWAGARMRRDRELACDSRVLATLPDRERAAYGHTLIKAMTAMARDKKFARIAGAAAIVEDEAELEGRLTMIKTYRPARVFHRLSGITAAVALASAAFVQTWGVAQEQKPTTAPNSAAAAASSTESTTQEKPSEEETGDGIQNPFTGITDEAKLVELRDEAAKAGELVRACDAEMWRVQLRAANGNPYKDKIDFSELYKQLPSGAATNPDLKARIEAGFDKYLDVHVKDPDYAWRIYHLLYLFARDANDQRMATWYLRLALESYPRVKYQDAAKHSKFQHLVNELAMYLWDQKGVGVAEMLVTEAWKNDTRFAYFFDQPWTDRYAKEFPGEDRIAKLRRRMSEKPSLKQVTVLISPTGLLYEGQATTWDEIEKKLSVIPEPKNHFLAVGRTEESKEGGLGISGFFTDFMSDEIMQAVLIVTRLGFDHVSSIGYQPMPANAPKADATASNDIAPPVDPSDPLSGAVEREIVRSYFNASPEVQEFIRTTAKSFGRSRLWIAEADFPDLNAESREERVAYLSKLFQEGTYGRHICESLAEASVIKDKRLLPGLIKVAAYHRDDQDYDCRPKWMAIAALARQEDESAVPTLVPLVDHGNLNTRMWAQAALARITDQSFGADKQAWANWWNAAGKTPALTADDIKPWVAPGAKAAASTPENRLMVKVAADGSYSIADKKLDLPALVDALRQDAAKYSGVTFKVEQANPPVDITQLADAVRPLGIRDVTIDGHSRISAQIGSDTAAQRVQVAQAQNTKPPVIVSTVPKIGDAAVPADTKELRVTFDQDMAAGFSWTGGGPAFPESAGKAQWLDKRTCVFPVKLEPGKYYRLGINAPSFKNFQNTSGVPVAVSSFWFVTLGADGKPVADLQPPKVAELTPANGAKDVLVTSTELIVRFDRAMSDGASWTTTDGANQAVTTSGTTNTPGEYITMTTLIDVENEIPEVTGKPTWRDDKTCVLPVKLEPGKEYVLSLNNAWFINFQSAAGVPLVPVRYTFTTKAN